MGKRASKTIRVAKHVTIRRVRGPKKNTSNVYYWRCEVYDPGTQRRRKLWNRWGTLAEATAAATDTVELGHARPDTGEVHTEVRTLRDLVELWIGDAVESREDLSKGTKRNYRAKAKRLATMLGHVQIDMLTRRRLSTYRDRALREGRAPMTVKAEFRVLALASKWGREERLTNYEPAFPRLNARPIREKYTPTRDEVWAVLDHLEVTGAPLWARLGAFLLATTGARIGAIATLQWGALDLERGTMAVDWKGRARSVALSSSVAARLRAVRPAVWTPEARVLSDATADTIRKHLTSYIDAATGDLSIPRFTPHAFRRSVLNTLYESGEAIHEVADQLGQSPATALRAYASARPERKAEMMERSGLGERPEPDLAPNNVTALLSRREA